MSGGVDSSTISYIATKGVKSRLKTYALGLDENDEDLKEQNIFSIHKF